MNEVIPLTGTFFSGASAFYVKRYVNITSGSAVSGGFFETVFDGAPGSLSASALMDLTYGHSSASFQFGRSETFLNNEKQRVYKQMAKKLLGSEDSLFSYNNVVHNNLFFLMAKRRIAKDEIKKASVSVNVQSGNGVGDTLVLSDVGAASVFTDGPAGDEASLYSGSVEVGKVYYNAGVIAFHTGVFGSTINWETTLAAGNLAQVAITGNLDRINDGFRNRVNNVQFQNQTNLHSTIYFCRALNSEFNYSSNPTFLDTENRIVPTSGTDNQTRSYITKVGLYNAQNELLAVASLSEPVKKSPDNEYIIRTRLIW